MTQQSTNTSFHRQTNQIERGTNVADANSVEFLTGTAPNLATNPKRIWVDQATEQIKYTVDGSTIRTVQRELGIVNVKDFGAIGDGVTNDTAALQLAVSAVNTGTDKTLYFPDGTYPNSVAMTISGNNIGVVMALNAKILSTLSNINTFVFSGQNCSLTGGTIQYPTAFDAVNRKWENFESMVLITGDGFRASGVTLNTVYKVGFGIRNANDCVLSQNKITGNYPAASWTGVETAHYGIAYDPKGFAPPDGDIIIHGNIIKSCVQGVFLGNYDAGVGYAVDISNNVFEGCFNHGVYANGTIGALISGNSFNRCSLPIASLGKYATITNNSIYTYGTGNNNDLVGISVREASHCIVSGNIIKGDAPAMSVIIDLLNVSTDPPPTDTVDNNIVSNNIIDVVGLDSIAIRIGTTAITTNCFNNQVKNNIIRGIGRANLGLISILVTGASIGLNNQVTGNDVTVINNCYAIYMSRQKNANVSGNVVKLEYNAAGAEIVNLVNSVFLQDSLLSQNILKCDTGFGANINLRGIIEDATSTRNFVTGNSIKFDSATLSVKTEVIVQATSKSANNMLNGVYVA